jgi:hypothetical protein
MAAVSAIDPSKLGNPPSLLRFGVKIVQGLRRPVSGRSSDSRPVAGQPRSQAR